MRVYAQESQGIVGHVYNGYGAIPETPEEAAAAAAHFAQTRHNGRWR